MPHEQAAVTEADNEAAKQIPRLAHEAATLEAEQEREARVLAEQGRWIQRRRMRLLSRR